MSGFTDVSSIMFSKHETLELLLSRLHWSEVDLQLLVVPAGDSHASHVSDHSVLSRVGGRPWCPGPRVARPGQHQALAGSHWSLATELSAAAGAALRELSGRGRGLGSHLRLSRPEGLVISSL